MTGLPKYNWDQAEIMGFATARGFGALFIPATTVRKWASRDKIRAVGLAPGGAKLYSIAEVTACARPTVTP